MRRFWRFYFLRVILVLVVLQLGFFAWLQYRNHKPEAQADEVQVYEGHSVKFLPLRNDSDKDKDELALHEIGKPLRGTLTRQDNVLEYQAKYGFSGVDSFLYTVTDGKKESEKQYIKVLVEENLPPMVHKDVMQMYPGREITLPVLANDEDREGDSIFIEEFTQPLHGQITRKDNKFVYKHDHSSAKMDSFYYVLSDGNRLSENASVIIKIVGKDNPCYPWLSMDVGNPGVPGKWVCTGGGYTLSASGLDIWNENDQCHFAYQQAKGDCQVLARAESLENTHQWAKTGVMIRESMSAGSKNAFMLLSSGNGTVFQHRPEEGNSSESVHGSREAKAPYWLKLVRVGDVFTGYHSPDGKNWSEVGSVTIEMPAEVFIGLAGTSHVNETLCQSVFSGVKVNL